MKKLSSLFKKRGKPKEIVTEYVKETDIAAIREDFISRLPEDIDGAILDLGRKADGDTEYFTDRGLAAERLDISEKLAETAGRPGGAAVHRLEYTEIAAEAEYRAVWTRDSFVHLTYNELLDILLRLLTAMKRDGLMYASFVCQSYGNLKDAKLFIDIDEDAVRKLIDGFYALDLERIWVTSVPDGERRVHIFARKR